MKFEGPPQSNLAENLEPQKPKSQDQPLKAVSITAQQETISTSGVSVRKESDTGKLAESRKLLDIGSKATQGNLKQRDEPIRSKSIKNDKDARRELISPNEQVESTTHNASAREVIGQQELTSFEKWIENIRNQDKIGEGAQKRIFVHPDDPRKIVAVFHKNQPVYKTKERFYVNKILNLLYPDNIPDIHLAASRPSVLVIDHIMGKEINPWNLKHQFFKIIIARRLKKRNILGKVKDI